jgi:hypothetical protein
MTKYILAGGYIVHKSPDGGKAFCEELIKGIDKKPIKILDCMFARPVDSWQEKMAEDEIFFRSNIKDFELELANPHNFVEQFKNSDIIFLRGGFIAQLVDMLNKDISWINYLSRKVIAGTSAGAASIAKYYYVGKTSRIGEGLNLLPIKLIAHWKTESTNYSENKIDWDRGFQELEKYKELLPIYTLKEGEFIVLDSEDLI